MNYKLIISPVVDSYPNAFTSFQFETEAELRAAADTCADLLLFLQDKAKCMRDESNMFILLHMQDGEWEELEDD